MGSGHFVVAMFERLVALRIAEKDLSEKAAVTAVIQGNLFGLEIDPRCSQIGAFNLALVAWRRVGHCVPCDEPHALAWRRTREKPTGWRWRVITSGSGMEWSGFIGFSKRLRAGQSDQPARC